MAAKDTIQIRITEELKNKFYETCKSNKEIPAEVVRELIKQYINSKSPK